MLNAGDYHLALCDVASGRITPVSTFDQGKSINPQWPPDSRRLFFVSDQNGISNVYRVNLQSGAIAQVTNVDSGISGITALSPAISSAIDSRTLALSAYEDGSYHIYVIDDAAAARWNADSLDGRTPAGGNAAASPARIARRAHAERSDRPGFRPTRPRSSPTRLG